jgi:hypothetical protein
MPDVDHPHADSSLERPRKCPQEPLVIRMYFKQHLIDLVRLFGYSEIPLDEAREKLKPLVDKYGKELMATAAEEIVFIDNSRSPAIARLTDHARKLAVGILGSPLKRQADPTSPPPEAPGLPPPSADAPVSSAIVTPTPADSETSETRSDQAPTSSPAKSRRARKRKQPASDDTESSSA